MTTLPLLALAASAFAAGPAPLTWPEAVAAALQRAPDLAAARLQERSGRYSYLGSFNAFLPRLSLSDSYSDSRGASGETRWALSGTASMTLFDAAKAADVSSAGASWRRAREALRDASAQARQDLRAAFVRLVLAQEGEGVSEAILAIRARGAEMVRLRYDSGRESKGNMLRTEAERLSAEADVAQARRDRRVAQAALARLVGLADYPSLAAAGSLEAAAPPDPGQDLAPLAAVRPDVAQAAASSAAAEADTRRARSALWPTLATSYTRGWADRVELPHGHPAWSFGATLSLPLFSGGPTQTAFASLSSRAALMRARELERSAREKAVEDLEGRRAAFAGAADQRRVSEALLEASRQRNDESDVRYASGLMNYENWQSIVTERVGAERAALRARADAVVAEAAWDRAVGRPLGEP